MGIRRSGKSGILNLLRSEILKQTDENHIIYVNFEDLEFENILTYKDLHSYIIDKMVDDKTYYLLLDEIQIIDNWEKAVNSLRLKNTDIYITGSNSRLLSGELATLITGRYVAFTIYPLSYKEFLQFATAMNRKVIIDDYIDIGGFPILSFKEYSDKEVRTIVSDINSSIILKDVIKRNNIKNTDLLDKIISFIYDNIGNLVSLRKISKYLISINRSGDLETIAKYLSYLQDACIIYKAHRYDIKKKRILESNEKYYIADQSLQYSVRDNRKDKIQGILENIVYMDLIRRGYKVYVGKIDTDKEITFVAEKYNGKEKIYVQVNKDILDEKTREREFSILKKVKDNYPKYVVVLNRYWGANEEGIIGLHLEDFLLKSEL
jgi:predicted AAA+ superfamily ATPase